VAKFNFQKGAAADVENAADARKPGDAKEDAADGGKMPMMKGKMPPQFAKSKVRATFKKGPAKKADPAAAKKAAYFQRMQKGR
jgi:hypothetical protein